MGAAVSTSTAEAVQKAVNTTYQSASNECNAECNQLISGNVIVLDNSKAGNITFTQRCTADASCYMKNALEQAVVTFQKVSAEAAAAPALYPGLQLNVSNASTKSDITNNLTQVMENLCNATVNQTIQDNIIYATNSTTGDIGFLQEGNAAARCVMENSGRLQLQMRQEGDATAKAGAAASLISAIIGLVIVVIIIIVISRALKKNTQETPTGEPGADGMGGKGKPGSTTGTKSSTGSMFSRLQGQFGGGSKAGATGSKTGAKTTSFKGLKK